MENRLNESLRLYQICVHRRRTDKDYQRFCFEAANMAGLLWQRGDLDDAARLIAEVIHWLNRFEIAVDLQAAQVTGALIDWERGDKAGAIRQLKSIWSMMDAAILPEPVKTLFEIYSVFERADHPLTRPVIDVAHRTIARLAEQIEDPQIRHLFLTNVPYCVWLRAGFDRYGLPAITITSNP